MLKSRDNSKKTNWQRLQNSILKQINIEKIKLKKNKIKNKID
jgi:hypothetical protein